MQRLSADPCQNLQCYFGATCIVHDNKLASCACQQNCSQVFKLWFNYGLLNIFSWTNVISTGNLLGKMNFHSFSILNDHYQGVVRHTDINHLKTLQINFKLSRMHSCYRWCRSSAVLMGRLTTTTASWTGRPARDNRRSPCSTTALVVCDGLWLCFYVLGSLGWRRYVHDPVVKCDDEECRYGSECIEEECVCPSNCSTEEEPVCATDGSTHINECALLAFACNRRLPVAVAYLGDCEEELHVEGGVDVFVFKRITFCRRVHFARNGFVPSTNCHVEECV